MATAAATHAARTGSSAWARRYARRTLTCQKAFTRFIRERTSLELDVRALDARFTELGMDELDVLAITLAVADLGSELPFDAVEAAGTLRSVLGACRNQLRVPSPPSAEPHRYESRPKPPISASKGH